MITNKTLRQNPLQEMAVQAGPSVAVQAPAPPASQPAEEGPARRPRECRRRRRAVPFQHINRIMETQERMCNEITQLRVSLSNEVSQLREVRSSSIASGDT